MLLHLVGSVSRDVPVMFIDTLRLFPETLAYRDTLVERLGLTRRAHRRARSGDAGGRRTPTRRRG